MDIELHASVLGRAPLVAHLELGAVPRVGDAIELHAGDERVSFEVTRVTWYDRGERAPRPDPDMSGAMTGSACARIDASLVGDATAAFLSTFG